MEVQLACDRCSQGVMDADRYGLPNGNPHLYPGRCGCACHRNVALDEDEQWDDDPWTEREASEYDGAPM